MRYPLDKICVKSGVLCPRCQRLVDTGVVGKYEIPIMKEMIELEEELKGLREGVYIKAYIRDNLVVVLVRGLRDRMLREKLNRELSARLKKRVRVVEKSGDIRDIIEQVIAPATLLGVNTLWMANGTEQIIVRVPRREHRFMADRLEAYEKILEEILGKPVKIRFESF